MNEQTNRGKLIVFEGIDGSGKSTQIESLYRFLCDEGIPCVKTSEPSTGAAGRLLRQCLRGEVEMNEKSIALLFAADRIDHICNRENGLLKLLGEGTTVLCDRYYSSSLAYQGSYLPIGWVKEINRMAMDLLRPDLTVFLEIAPEDAIARICRRGEEQERYEKLESLRAIRENYKQVFRELRALEPIACIPSADIETTAGMVREVVRGVLDGTLQKEGLGEYDVSRML